MVLYVATSGNNEAYKYQGPKNNKNKKNQGAFKNEFCLSRNSKFVAAFCLVTAYN